RREVQPDAAGLVLVLEFGDTALLEGGNQALEVFEIDVHGPGEPRETGRTPPDPGAVQPKKAPCPEPIGISLPDRLSRARDGGAGGRARGRRSLPRSRPRDPAPPGQVATPAGTPRARQDWTDAPR